MKIFISHSEKNGDIATALVSYLLSALSIDDNDIRCTSAPGHKLPFGKSIAELLRDDLTLAPTLIVLTTEESIKATWVMFELGAAWGLKRDIIPILAPGIQIKDLPSLLSSVPCILIDNSAAPSRLSGLVNQLSTKFKLQCKSGEKTQSNLESFVNLFRAYKSENAEEPVSNSVKFRSTITQQELILQSIWKLDADHNKYSNIGYDVKTISIASGLNIPKCEHLLEALIDTQYISKKEYLSPRGYHYKLEKKCREYLMNKYPDLTT